MIHQTLGNVIHGHAKILGDSAHIDNAFMSDKSMGARVQNREVRIKSTSNIVRIHNGHFGRKTNSGGTHQSDVRPRNWQDAGRTKVRSRHWSDRLRTEWCQRVSWQEVGQVLTYCDRSDAWSTTTVRNTESLMQIQVADIGSKHSGLR